MNAPSSRVLGEALAGLALLVAPLATADESLREAVHRQYRHQSYMLVEDARGARLYLFGRDGRTLPLQVQPDRPSPWLERALEKLQNPDSRIRVRGLTELAGVASPAALDAALALLNDPIAAVRDEAVQLIVDHPDGESVANALGLRDEDEED